jgi:hypothetical protein
MFFIKIYAARRLEKMGALAHLNQLLFTEMNYLAVFK